MKIERVILKNFLIIPEASIELSPGFNVVTGETGSGKSLFVGAVRLLCGERAPKGIIGRWGEKAEITAFLSLEPKDSDMIEKLAELCIEVEDNSLIIRRIVGDKNFCFVNSVPVNIGFLESLLADKIEISSQFENQSIFKHLYQIQFVDSCVLSKEISDSYYSDYIKLRELTTEIEKLSHDDDPARRDYLEFQIAEIEKFDLKDGEVLVLEEKIRLVENRNKITKMLAEMSSGFDSATQVLGQLLKTAGNLKELVHFTEEYERFASAVIEISDIEHSVLNMIHTFDEPMDEESLRERFDLLNTLMMKHGVKTEESLIAKVSAMNRELNELNQLPEKIELLQKELYKLEKSAREKALNIRKIRVEKLPAIEKKITDYLITFGMTGINFRIELSVTDELNEYGLDNIKFLVNTTGGNELHSVKNMSGGELSRLLLALKLTGNEKGKFILFDEIDSNIGGEVASRAAEELKANSKQNQILVVTHFPQTAARGDAHLVVEKDSSGDGISSKLVEVKNSERIKELARMMGDSSSKEHLLAAEKLIGRTL